MAIPCRETLEHYLAWRAGELSGTTLKHYRWILAAFIDFLEAAFPEIDSFSELTRDHVVSWLEDLKNLDPPYSQNTRRLIVLQVRRVLRDIRAWGWPESPRPGLFERMDLPPARRSSKPRRRRPQSSWHGLIERYLEELTLSAGTICQRRVALISFVRVLTSRHPAVDSPAKLRRTPHVEDWLETIRQAPYTESTRRLYTEFLLHFFEDLRAWNWPQKPPSGLIQRDVDLPRLSARRRNRVIDLIAPDEESPTRSPFDDTLKHYLDLRCATLRPSTVAQYRSLLAPFFEFLTRRFPELDSLAKIRRSPHIEDWLTTLASVQPPYTNDTRRELIRKLRRFLEDLADWQWPDSPPPGLIRPEDFPPPQRHLPRPLSEEADAALCEALVQDGDLLSLALLVARRTGLRLGELLGLELDCLVESTEGHHSLRVPLGKLHSERVIPIDSETAELLRTIRSMRGESPPTVDPDSGRPLELLLANKAGRLCSASSLRKKLKNVAAAAGIRDNVVPHRLRHTYATELLRHGVSLPGVMKLLGHRKIGMTLRYVEITNRDLGKNYLEAIERVRHRYAALKNLPRVSGSGSEDETDPAQTVDTAVDQLIARVQAVRFDHPDPARRKRLQRLVERLRRAQADLAELLG